MSETEGESSQGANVSAKMEAFGKVFDFVSTLQKESLPESIRVFGEGRTDAVQTSEIVNSAESLDVSSLRSGDVFWWESRDGSNGYFLVSRTTPHKTLEGSLRVVGKDGKISSEEEKAILNGGTTGGMVRPGMAMQGFPLEIGFPSRIKDIPSEEVAKLPDDEVYALLPKTIPTPPIVNMGVIPASQIPSELNS